MVCGVCISSVFSSPLAIFVVVALVHLRWMFTFLLSVSYTQSSFFRLFLSLPFLNIPLGEYVDDFDGFYALFDLGLRRRVGRGGVEWRCLICGARRGISGVRGGGGGFWDG